MNTVILQYWEESERGWGVRPDGCSLHISNEDCSKYIKTIYDARTGNIPDEYDRVVGDPIVVSVKSEIYDILLKNKDHRVYQHELNNLFKFNDIIL